MRLFIKKLSQKKRIRQWGWFLGLWLLGFFSLFFLSFLIKLLMSIS